MNRHTLWLTLLALFIAAAILLPHVRAERMETWADAEAESELDNYSEMDSDADSDSDSDAYGDMESDIDADIDAEVDAHDRAESEADMDAESGFSSDVLDSAAATIESEAAYSAELNSVDGVLNSATSVPALEAGTAEANEYNLAQLPVHEGKNIEAESKDPAYAFISTVEHAVPITSAPQSDDVEQNLDTIQLEIGSLFNNAAQASTTTEEQQQTLTKSKSRRGRISARKMRAHHRVHHAPVMQSAMPPSSPLPPQAAISSQYDAYHSEQKAPSLPEPVSILESMAHSRSAHGAGYSMPVSGIVSPAVAFQGQVAVNPAFASPANPMWSALGLTPPAPIAAVAPVQPVAAVAPVAAPATSVAGVGALLSALKQFQQQEEQNSLVKKLAALISAASTQQQLAAAVARPVATAAPAVIQSPFNYGQPLVATGVNPLGVQYQNPNLMDNTHGVPRLLPGSFPGQSPAYPTYIPTENQSVGVEEEQENPFANHQP
jgi:hypothetical protein